MVVLVESVRNTRNTPGKYLLIMLVEQSLKQVWSGADYNAIGCQEVISNVKSNLRVLPLQLGLLASLVVTHPDVAPSP